MEEYEGLAKFLLQHGADANARCKVMSMLSNLIHQYTAMVCTPKSSGGHLSIYIPLWMAYALQLGSCSAVPLLCGG